MPKLSHSMTNTSEYRTWAMMKDRCSNPKSQNYKYYGGKGIKVCERWLKFTNFYEDMGPKPSSRHTLDRVDSDGAYCEDNCRWATPEEQSRNRDYVVLYSYEGEELPLSEIAKRKGINQQTLQARLTKGWTVERTLNTPVRQWRRK